MADKHLEAQANPKTGDNEVHQRLLDDTSFNKYLSSNDNSNQLSGITNSQFGRGAYALVEGITQTPHGIFNAIQHDIKNPHELIGKAATGAAFGVGLRLLLPKAGAARALVGTTMSYFFIKDALHPIINTWQDASIAEDMDSIHKAASKMGDGLGHFAVDSVIAMGAGAIAEGGTGALLNRSKLGRGFEAWKEVQFNSETTPLGRFFKWSERTADGVSGALAEKLLGKSEVGPEIPIAEKMRLIQEANKHAAAEVRQKAGVLDKTLDTRRQYRSEDFSSNIDALLGGERPQVPGNLAALAERPSLPEGPNANRFKTVKMAEEAGPEVTAPRAGERRPHDVHVDEGLAGTLRPELAESRAPRVTGGAAKPNEGGAAKPNEGGAAKPNEGGAAKPNEGGAAKPNEGGAAKPNEGSTTPTDGTVTKPNETAPPTDGGKPPSPPANRGQFGELDGDNVGAMAVSMRQAAGRVTKEDIAVAQVKEDMKGPILDAMRGGKPPLDPGHFSNNQMLAALSDQIKTADEVRQVGNFLDHFRTANQQLLLAVLGERGGLPEILDLNQYSRSIHAQLLTALDKNGIPRTVLRGTNSPMFTIRDSDGAGPYTIPAIPGVSDAAVITYPREYQGRTPTRPDRPSMVGVHTAGVYPHELGHDLIYGDLAKFPEQSRSGWLNERVVGQAMKLAKIEDTEIQVPGAPNGVMKKSDFFVQLLKAQANENTADMFGASIDPNTGLSLAVLLGSLRKPGTANPKGPGQLETRSMYGKEMIDEHMENTLGIEPHGIDRWRIKLAAETLRHLSNGHEGIMKYADKLDKLADSTSRPGTQYVWAYADEPGKFVAIPIKEWDAIIPSLVKAQFDTPLASLNNKTLKDLAPNMAERFPKIEALAEAVADAALKNQATLPAFDKGNYRIEEVVSAGLSGWMKAIEAAEVGGQKIPPGELMNRINRINDALRAQYRDDMPELSIPGPKEPTSLTAVATRPLGFMARSTGQLARFQPLLREKFASGAGRFTSYAGSHLLSAPLSASLQDLMDHKRIQDQMLNQGDNNR